MEEKIDNILEGFYLGKYDLLEVRKQLLVLYGIGGLFTVTDMQRAYDDGYSTDGEVTFDINDYQSPTQGVVNCNHDFQRVERGGEFEGNQCHCGEWENLT